MTGVDEDEVTVVNVLIAIDSFKGSLTSLQAGNAVKDAILEVDGSAEVAVRPLADGGEGTVEALSAGLGGTLVRIPVTHQHRQGALCNPDRET